MTEAECLDDALTALLQSLSVCESLGERFVSIPDLDGFWRAYDGALNDLAISRAWRRLREEPFDPFNKPVRPYVPAGFVIHHVDGDPLNNDPANLRLVDPKAKP
jgi:hypothetical protein